MDAGGVRLAWVEDLRTERPDAAFSLLEVMIAAVVVVILAMGLAGSMGSAFMAANAARSAAASTNACQQALEQLEQLPYADVLNYDGAVTPAPGGVTVKISVTEAAAGMILIEVYAWRPTQSPTVPAVAGSQVRLLTYRSMR